MKPRVNSAMPSRLLGLFGRSGRRRLAALFSFMMVGAILEVVGIGIVPAFIAIVAEPDRLEASATARRVLASLEISSQRDLMVWGSFALIALYFLKNLVLTGIYYYQAGVTTGFQLELSDRLFRAYLGAPYAFHLNRNTAELLRNVNVETMRIVTGILGPGLDLVLNVMMTLFVVALLLSSEPLVSVLALTLLLGGGGTFLLVTRARVGHHARVTQQEWERRIKAVNQGLGGLKEIKTLGKEKYFAEAFWESASKTAEASRAVTFTRSLAAPVLETIAVAGLLSVGLALVFLGRDLVSVISTLTLFGLGTVRLRSSASRIVDDTTQIRYAGVALDPIVDDLERLAPGEFEEDEGPNRVAPPGGKGPATVTVRFTDVSYRYPGASRDSITDVSFSVPRGSVVAFVGTTGAGKSTLVNIMLGLLRPRHGRVEYEGGDIFRDMAAWRRRLGYVPQSVYLLDDTIRRNVAFGVADEQIDDEQVWNALRAAQLGGFVAALDEGLSTETGERGVRVSGGQQQRIAVARALYHEPEVLLLDEATAALDSSTERSLMEAIHALRGDRTIVVVAHRLSTVRKCDRIFGVEEGRIVDDGTYEELMDRSDAFRRIALEAQHDPPRTAPASVS